MSTMRASQMWKRASIIWKNNTAGGAEPQPHTALPLSRRCRGWREIFYASLCCIYASSVCVTTEFVVRANANPIIQQLGGESGRVTRSCEKASITSCCDIVTPSEARKKTVGVLSVIYLAASAVIALGYSVFYCEISLPNGSVGQLLDLMGYVSNSVMMPFIALLSALLIGWVKSPDYVIEEVESSGAAFRRKRLYAVMVRFVVPVMMLILFLQPTGIMA